MSYMNQLCKRLTSLKCVKHGKPCNFICFEEVCRHYSRGMCPKCINLSNTRDLFNIENMFEFLENEQQTEEVYILTWKSMLWQNFQHIQNHIIEQLQQLESQFETLLEQITGNPILNKIKRYNLDGDMNGVLTASDIEQLGRLIGTSVDQAKYGQYRFKNEQSFEQKQEYILSIEIINALQQISSILNCQTKASQLKNLTPQNNNNKKHHIWQDQTDISNQEYRTIQSISVDDECSCICFNHNETQIAAAVRKSIIIFNQTNQGLWVKEYQKLIGHDEQILQVKFNYNSSQIASCDQSGLIIIWNQQAYGNWSIQSKLTHHTKSVSSICYNQDSTLLASSGEQMLQVYYFNNTKWKKHQQLKDIQSVGKSICFNHDSTLFASGCTDNSIRIWELDYRKIMRLKQILTKHEDQVRAIQFNAKSTLLVSASNDKTVRVWQINESQNWECINTLNGHTDIVRSVTFHGYSDMIVSSSSDKSIMIWDNVSKNKWICQQTIKKHKADVNCIIVSKSTSVIISTSNNRNIMVHKPFPNLLISDSVTKTNNSNNQIYMNATKSLIALTLWNEIKLFKINELQNWVDIGQTLIGHSDMIKYIEFDHNSTQMVSCGFDNLIVIWTELDDKTWSKQNIKSHTNAIYKATFNKDSTLMASASLDTTIQVYYKKYGQWYENQLLKEHNQGVFDVNFSQDLPLLASAGQDKFIIIWEKQAIDEWEVKQKLVGHTNYVGSVQFQEGSEQLISSSADYTIRVWAQQYNVWQCIHTINATNDYANVVQQAQFSIGSDRIISRYSDNSFKIWKLYDEEWKCIETITKKDKKIKYTFYGYNFGILLSVEYNTGEENDYLSKVSMVQL